MAVLIFVVVISILIIVHESGHFFVAKRIGVRVERFAIGFGPKVFSIKKAETEYAVCAIPLGGYVKMAGDERSSFKQKKDEYLAQSPGNRFKIVFAGSFLNYIFALVLFYFVFLFGLPTFSTTVGGVLDGFPAKMSGVQVGDKIISVGSVAVNDWEQMTKLIRERKAEDINLVILRKGEKISLTVKTKVQEDKNLFGKPERVGKIGITPTQEIVKIKHGPFESLRLASQRLLQLTAITYKSIWMMLTGAMSFRETVSGPLGIFSVTSQAASFGVLALMHVMAVISLSLAIFNLLPVPVLDGGHIVLLFVESLRKKPLSEKVENIYNQIGMALLLTLALLVTLNDLHRFNIIEKIMKFFKK